MKKFLVFAFLLFSVLNSFAECAMGAVTFFPKQNTVSQNSLFIVEAYGFDQSLIESIQKDRKAYLENEEGEKVDLILVEILYGQKSITQAVFKPTYQLKLNHKYYLKFTEIPGERNFKELKRYNSKIGKSEPVAWEVTEIESERLLKDLSLEFDKTEVNFYGCGPDAYAIFLPQNVPSSETWYKAEVYDEQTKTSSSFILTEWQGKIQVGHGMCGGAFKFNKDGNYKVRFTPMNIDGKEHATTEWTAFESPYKTAVDPFYIKI
ncbi:hypothetical protein JYB64_15170 [Algoriphagus aestuarii]|nr:hypothetical protein [Algoriphagus aestuarii]